MRHEPMVLKPRASQPDSLGESVEIVERPIRSEMTGSFATKDAAGLRRRVARQRPGDKLVYHNAGAHEALTMAALARAQRRRTRVPRRSRSLWRHTTP